MAITPSASPLRACCPGERALQQALNDMEGDIGRPRGQTRSGILAKANPCAHPRNHERHRLHLQHLPSLSEQPAHRRRPTRKAFKPFTTPASRSPAFVDQLPQAHPATRSCRREPLPLKDLSWKASSALILRPRMAHFHIPKTPPWTARQTCCARGSSI